MEDCDSCTVVLFLIKPKIKTKTKKYYYNRLQPKPSN